MVSSGCEKFCKGFLFERSLQREAVQVYIDTSNRLNLRKSLAHFLQYSEKDLLSLMGDLHDQHGGQESELHAAVEGFVDQAEPSKLTGIVLHSYVPWTEEYKPSWLAGQYIQSIKRMDQTKQARYLFKTCYKRVLLYLCSQKGEGGAEDQAPIKDGSPFIVKETLDRYYQQVKVDLMGLNKQRLKTQLKNHPKGFLWKKLHLPLHHLQCVKPMDMDYGALQRYFLSHFVFQLYREHYPDRCRAKKNPVLLLAPSKDPMIPGRIRIS